ncbi:unnamed protein product, partial [Mesorhabditis spiculigera]
MFGHRLVRGLFVVWLLCGVFQPVSVFPSAASSPADSPPDTSSHRHTSTESNAPSKDIVSQAEDFSAHHSLRVKRACRGRESFACVAKSIIDGLPAGAASKKSSISDTGCENCDLDECQLLDGRADDLRSLVNDASGRAVAKCTPKDDACGYTKSSHCLKPVSFVTDGQEHSELFPFNLCTRKMVVDGTCPEHLLSTSPYDATKLKISLRYHVQCDVGFMVPPIAADIGCVPSLHQAAGLGPEDPPIFPDDFKDFNNIKFCAAGMPLPDPLDCVPRPLKGFPLAAGLPESVKNAAADTPCLYDARGAKKGEGCVLLDLLIPPSGSQKEPMIIPGDRKGLGPYAALPSPYVNLFRQWTPHEEPHRIFPRCIDVSRIVGLTDKHIEEVQSDYFLNCATNPYYQKAVKASNQAQMAALKMEPSRCAKLVDSESLFCRWLDFPKTPTGATAAEKQETSPGGLVAVLFSWPCLLVYNVILYGCLIGGRFYLRRRFLKEWNAIPVPDLDWQKILEPEREEAPEELKTVVAKFVEDVCQTGPEELWDQWTRASNWTPEPRPSTEAFNNHMEKNRFALFPCADHNRFKLANYDEADEKGSDYINASMFKLKGCEAHWIATQAPMPNTRDDFWRMMFSMTRPDFVAQNFDAKIYCLNNIDPVPNGANFWPCEFGEGAVWREKWYCAFGKWSPYLTTVIHERDVATYYCQVERHIGAAACELQKPAIYYPASGKDFRSKVRAIARLVNFEDPVVPVYVVVCSSGAAWSAVFIMVFVIIDRLTAGTEVSVTELWHELRTARPYAITDAKQWLAVHMAVFEYIKVHLPEHNDAIERFLDAAEKVAAANGKVAAAKGK